MCRTTGSRNCTRPWARELTIVGKTPQGGGGVVCRSPQCANGTKKQPFDLPPPPPISSLKLQAGSSEAA
eukprot:5967491-Alexandrium_andersonii.AAC.1